MEYPEFYLLLHVCGTQPLFSRPAADVTKYYRSNLFCLFCLYNVHWLGNGAAVDPSGLPYRPVGVQRCCWELHFQIIPLSMGDPALRLGFLRPTFPLNRTVLSGCFQNGNNHFFQQFARLKDIFQML